MARFVKVMQDFGLLIARLGIGWILLMHGWTRWQGTGQGVRRQIDYLTQFGTPYPQVAAWGSIVFELLGGVCLIVGALTPLIGLGILVQQVLTVAYTNWYKHFPLLNTDCSYNGGYEYNVALGRVGLLFAVFGAGSLSIDRLFRSKKPVMDEDESSVTTAVNRRVSV
jgi:putative oxidoreductase